jgi:hypothetical protein
VCNDLYAPSVENGGGVGAERPAAGQNTRLGILAERESENIEAVMYFHRLSPHILLTLLSPHILLTLLSPQRQSANVPINIIYGAFSSMKGTKYVDRTLFLSTEQSSAT